MNTQTFSIDLPADILLSINVSEDELKQSIKTSLAIRLYRQEKLTLGKAAQLAGLSRFDFETFLAENDIPISNLSIKEVVEDMKKLK
jgi:predicted HTH domain antitoxin